jgi:hypothetical protein
MQHGRKTNMNRHQKRPFAGRSQQRPELHGSHNARRNYDRYVALAQSELQAGDRVAGAFRLAPTVRAVPKRLSSSFPSASSSRAWRKNLFPEMLASGEIDCAIIARPPACFLAGDPRVTRLFPDYLAMEEQYYDKTRVWPIMHIIAMQKRILAEHPWIARNLYSRIRGVKAPQPRAAVRSCCIAVSAGVAADLCAAHTRHFRRRPVSFRNRAESRHL